MNKNNASMPIVATSNGWTPIEFFDFDSYYAQRQAFLVWMADAEGREWFEVGRAKRGSIVSEWRNIYSGARSAHEHGGDIRRAFKLVEGPDLRVLQDVHKRCARHFSHVQLKERPDGT